MRHTEVTKTPCKGGNDGKESVALSVSAEYVEVLTEVVDALDTEDSRLNVLHTACILDTEADDNEERNRHND